MTKKDLNQYYYLLREIELDKKQKHKLQLEIAELEQRPPLADMASGSMHQTPFKVHGVRIEGIPKSECKRLVRLRNELNETIRLIELKNEQKVLQECRTYRYIQDIDDSMTRTIATMRFIDCEKWEDIAAFIGGNNTKDSVRVAMDRYIESHPG